MKQPITRNTRPGFQRGLSLIELMISITIGLIILISLSTLFINQSRTRAELDKSNRMIDNGRYAMDLLSSNLKLAGFYDSYVPTGPVVTTTLPDPCDLTTVTNLAKRPDTLRLHVQGYNASTSAVPSPAFNTVAPLCATILTNNNVTLKPGSDILVIRRASTTPITALTLAALTSQAASGVNYLQVSGCQTDPAPGYTIDNTTTTSAFPLLKVNCQTAALPADLRPFLIQVYFVSTDDNPSANFTGTRTGGCTGDCIPTLKRLEFDASGTLVITPLVEGIEFMQIDYGIDDNNNGVADRYVDCSTCVTVDVANILPLWSNVVSVKINLLARNLTLTQGWNEGKTYNLGIDGAVGSFGYDVTAPVNSAYKRHAYTELVRLANPAGRKELPCPAPCR